MLLHTWLVYAVINLLALKFWKEMSVEEDERSFSVILPADDRREIIYKQGLNIRKR